MKKRIVLAAAAAAAILTGCVVTSVCPFYTQKDLVIEPGILGNWINAKAPNEVWKFERSGDFGYQLTFVEPDKATILEAHAFKLQGQLFLDVFSLEQDYHVIPGHYLLKVTQTAPALKMSELDDTWLKALLARDPTTLRHHLIENAEHPAANRIVLTANTAELQNFISRHIKTQNAWKDTFELRREIREIPSTYTVQMKGP